MGRRLLPGSSASLRSVPISSQTLGCVGWLKLGSNSISELITLFLHPSSGFGLDPGPGFEATDVPCVLGNPAEKSRSASQGTCPALGAGEVSPLWYVAQWVLGWCRAALPKL